MKRSCLCVAALCAASVATACSTYELEGLAAAFDDAEGTFYYDDHKSRRVDCQSGQGYVTWYEGVQSNQAYSYVYNNSNQTLELTQYVSEESQGREQVRPGQQSQTIWFHPYRSGHISYYC
jgi:hypothetical protein